MVREIGRAGNERLRPHPGKDTSTAILATELYGETGQRANASNSIVLIIPTSNALFQFSKRFEREARAISALNHPRAPSDRRWLRWLEPASSAGDWPPPPRPVQA